MLVVNAEMGWLNCCVQFQWITLEVCESTENESFKTYACEILQVGQLFDLLNTGCNSVTAACEPAPRDLSLCIFAFDQFPFRRTFEVRVRRGGCQHTPRPVRSQRRLLGNFPIAWTSEQLPPAVGDSLRKRMVSTGAIFLLDLLHLCLVASPDT